jgi:hypothetical protein
MMAAAVVVRAHKDLATVSNRNALIHEGGQPHASRTEIQHLGIKAFDHGTAEQPHLSTGLIGQGLAPLIRAAVIRLLRPLHHHLMGGQRVKGQARLRHLQMTWVCAT